MHAPEPSGEFKTYAGAREGKPLLRVLACGSAGAGTSTLVGRLLGDSKVTFDGPSTGGGPEQAGSRDIGYHSFATGLRQFVVADVPGDEPHTREIAAAAPDCDLALVVIDASQGVASQTRRYAYIASLAGIRHVVLAVNKSDLVGFSQDAFDDVVSDFLDFAAPLGFAAVVPIPVSASLGDNVTAAGTGTPWYTGAPLLQALETIDVERALAGAPFRMPVQSVVQLDSGVRGYSGTVAGGAVKVGDTVAAAKSGRPGTVTRMLGKDGDIPVAGVGAAVTLALAEAIDIAPGDVVCAATARPEVSDQFAAHLVWMGDEQLYPGRQYILRLATSAVTAQVTALKHKVDVDNLEHLAAKTLHLNEIGYVNVSLAEPIAFDRYRDNRVTGGFILIDRFTNATVGVGMIDFGLRRATNVHWQALDVDKHARAGLKLQKPVALWFTGLSGSGKSTIANLVERTLHAHGRHTYILDGDNVRHGLNRDLGFTEEDRVENIRRVAETAKLFVDAGLIVLVSFISPFRSERRMARELMGEGEFVEVFVDTPIEVCMTRDPKGLYQKAKAGTIKNFTGIDSPYEAPDAADIVVRTVEGDAAAHAAAIVGYLRERGYCS